LLEASRAAWIDVRVLAATNRDLRKEVNRGRFRTDLYFRLAVSNVHMPALREHSEDIPHYVAAMLAEWSESGSSVQIDAETIARLQAQPWPGNVRELRNTVERAVLLGELNAPAESAPTQLRRRARAASASSVDPDAVQGRQGGADRAVRAQLRRGADAALRAEHHARDAGGGDRPGVPAAAAR
jgi:two-component system response regulator PilR (NtrC family)